jgi:NADPH2:quinone reductase
MKEAIVHKGTVVEIIDSPIPEPGPDDVVTKVIVSGSNPKDWCEKPHGQYSNLNR